MKLFTSMILLQKEKLIVIKKELRHLHNIAFFYDSPLDPSSQRDRISKTLQSEIANHIKYIKDLHELIDENQVYIETHAVNIIPFLTRYDEYNHRIKELLRIVQFIQAKLSQFLQDSFNQYLPIPMTSKRYSSKGFLDYLKKYYEDILDVVVDTNEALNISPIIFWGHITDFTAEESVINSNSKHYIKTAYWNHEIPILLTAMSHELGHIIIKQEDKGELRELYENFENFIIKIKKQALYGINDDSSSFLDEIISDFFAYMTLGDSYLLTMAHELLGKGFSRQFYKHGSSDKMDSDIRFGELGDDLTTIESLARLKILIGFRLIDKKRDDILNEVVNEIIDVVDHIVPQMDFDKDSDNIRDHYTKQNIINALNQYNKYNSLLKYYAKDYPCLLTEYKEFHASVFNLVYTSIKHIGDTDIIFRDAIAPLAQKLENKSEIQDFKKIFIKLWKIRLKLLDHSITKNLFRKEILSSGQNSGQRIDGTPYELTFFKTRTDAYKEEKTYKKLIEKLTDDISVYHHNNQYFKESTPTIYTCFDLFNVLSISEKRTSLQSKLISEFLSAESDKKPYYFYSYKHSLIMLDNVSLENNSESNTSQFNLIIQLQLKENSPLFTERARTAIKKYINASGNGQNSKIKFDNLQVFKSLGPKEIVLNFTSIDLDSIFTLKEMVVNLKFKDMKIFRRTYSTIYGKFDDLNGNIKEASSRIHNISTTLRLKSHSTDIKKLLLPHKNKIQILHTTGVTDIHIVWDESVSLAVVFEFYDQLIENGVASDIQTKINEIYQLINNND